MVGLYLIVSLIMGVNSGQFYLLKDGTVISLSDEPEKFWAIAFIQSVVFMFCVILYFPKLSMISLTANRDKKKKTNTLGQAIAEIEIYIAYGKIRKANDLIQSFLIKNPSSKKLLALREKVSSKLAQ